MKDDMLQTWRNNTKSRFYTFMKQNVKIAHHFAHGAEKTLPGARLHFKKITHISSGVLGYIGPPNCIVQEEVGVLEVAKGSV